MYDDIIWIYLLFLCNVSFAFMYIPKLNYIQDFIERQVQVSDPLVRGAPGPPGPVGPQARGGLRPQADIGTQNQNHFNANNGNGWYTDWATNGGRRPQDSPMQGPQQNSPLGTGYGDYAYSAYTNRYKGPSTDWNYNSNVAAGDPNDWAYNPNGYDAWVSTEPPVKESIDGRNILDLMNPNGFLKALALAEPEVTESPELVEDQWAAHFDTVEEEEEVKNSVVERMKFFIG